MKISVNLKAVSVSAQISQILSESDLPIILQYYILKDLADSCKQTTDKVVSDEFNVLQEEVKNAEENESEKEEN